MHYFQFMQEFNLNSSDQNGLDSINFHKKKISSIKIFFEEISQQQFNSDFLKYFYLKLFKEPLTLCTFVTLDQNKSNLN